MYSHPSIASKNPLVSKIILHPGEIVTHKCRPRVPLTIVSGPHKSMVTDRDEVYMVAVLGEKEAVRVLVGNLKR